MKKISAFLILICILSGFVVKAQVIALPKPIYTYKQNFDSLANSGTSSSLPNGWYIYETGSSANSTYTADSGSLSIGDTYSYGHKGSSDRSLGSLATSSLQSYIGAQFKNTSGYSINSITISFTVKQWRLGATGRADSMTAEVSPYATAINSPSFYWVGLSPLNFRSPVTSGTTGQLDGNNPSNQKKYSFTLSGISVSNGSSIWVRWHDQNISGNNDGLAIDDFSLSIKAYIPHTIVSSKFPQSSGIPDTTQTGVWTGVVLGPNYSSSGLNFQFHDNTGSITAINPSKTYGYSPAIGDSVAVYGQIKSTGYLTYISVDSVGKISSGRKTGLIPTVTNVNNDTLESGLVRINKMSLAPGYKWDTTGNGKNGGYMTSMTNGTNTYNIWISKYTDLWGKPAPKFPFNLTGLVLQNSSNASSGYYISPRGAFDFDTIRFPLYKIIQVKGQVATTGISDSAGNNHPLFLKGVVQSASFLKSTVLLSIYDNTAAIMVAMPANPVYYAPSIGDSILVRGLINQVKGITEIAADSIITLKKATNTLKTATTITKPDESTEASLVVFRNVTIVDSTKWIPAGTSFVVKYTNGKDTVDVAIYENTDLYKLKHAPKGKFNISGIGGQNKPTLPYIGGYQIWPRGLIDYEKILPFKPTPLYKIRQLKGYDKTTGVADSAQNHYPPGRTYYIKGVVYSRNFDPTRTNFDLKDSTGGLYIYSYSTNNGISPNIGDSLLIRGYVFQNFGQTSFIADSFISLTKGSVLVSPKKVNVLNEATESDFVTLQNYYVYDTTYWRPGVSSFVAGITNGKDSTFVYVPKSTANKSTNPMLGTFNFTGIGFQQKRTSPYFGGYYLLSRDFSDWQHVIQLYQIKDVRSQNRFTGVADSLKQKNPFLLKGIVQSPNLTKTGFLYSIKDKTGSIFVSYPAMLNKYTPVTGDSIELRGIIVQTNGQTAILADSISKLISSNPVLSPKLVSGLAEADEATLETFKSARLIHPAQWTNASSGFDVDVSDPYNDTITIHISPASGMIGKPTPKWRFNVTGIVSQSKADTPYFGGYKLIPRSSADFLFLPPKLYLIDQVNNSDTVFGKADSLDVYCMVKGTVSCENLSGSNTNQLFTIQDSYGGISLSCASPVYGYIPNVGDSILVRGTIRQNNGFITMDIDSVAKLAAGTAITPKVILKLKEIYESNRVTLQGYRLVDATKWDTTNANGHFYIKIYKGTDTVLVRIMRYTDLYLNAAKPIGLFDITGVCMQNDSTIPYLQGYFLVPGSKLDIQHPSGINPDKNTSNVIFNLFPNPATGKVQIVSDQVIDLVQVTNCQGQIVLEQRTGGKNAVIDFGYIEPGTYFVKVKAGLHESIKQVVKE